MRYSQFTGREAKWPTTSGAMAEAAYKIPVYRGWPERPYEVIGSVRFEDPRKYWDDGIIRMAARTGKRNGGDAIIIPRFGSPSSWLDSFITRPTGYDEETKALVIRWTPEAQVKAAQQEHDGFWQKFRQQHPDLANNDQLVQLALLHFYEVGARPNTPELESKLTGLLTELKSQPKTDLSGKWLFGGAVQNRNLTTVDSSEQFHGVATVVTTGNRVTILSTAGKIEINFSGTVEAGQISGTLGFGGKASSLSVKCEGVALNEKISFAFQKLAESGTVQGNLTFQR